MNKQKNHCTERSGLILVMNIFAGHASAPQDDASPENPYPRPEGVEELPIDNDTVENLPMENPEIEPRERETPEINEIEENRPMDRPEIDPLERPSPDLDEVEPNTDREINSDPLEEEDESHLDRDPSIQPDTDPSTTGNFRVF